MRVPDPLSMISIHHLAAYGGAYAGSFIPMLTATAREAERRGNRTTIWLSVASRGREWLPELAAVAEIRWLHDDRDGRASIRRTAATVRAALGAVTDPVVLHTHFSAYDMVAALLGTTRPRTSVFWHEHGRPSRSPTVVARNVLKYSVVGRTVDRMLCVSPEIATDLRARHAPARAVLTFPNAIDLERFALVTPEMRRRARRSLGIDESARVVLHFSWDWRRKGGDVMLASADIMSTDLDLVWLTVPGPPGDERDAVDARPNVRRLASRGDVRELYAAADLFLSCSRSEGMPYAMLEAMACGLPVVASDLPGHRPPLEDLQGGLVVALDPAEIVPAVRQMLAMGEAQRVAAAQAARGRVTTSYSLEDWVRRLADLYDESLSRT